MTPFPRLGFAFLCGFTAASITACQPKPSAFGKLLAALESPSQDERAKAVEEIERQGTNAIPQLLHALKGTGLDARKMPSEADLQNEASQSPMIALVNQRRRALIAFKTLGPVASPAVPELKDMLTQKDTSIHAASALAFIGTEGVSVLLAQATSPDRRIQANVVQALSQLGDGAKESLPVFTAGLKHNLPAIRSAAAVVLGGLGTNSPPDATAALVGAITDKDTSVRERVIMALGKHGPAARAAAPALVVLLKDADTNTVNLAAHVLWKVDPEAARKAGAVDRVTVSLGKDPPPSR